MFFADFSGSSYSVGLEFFSGNPGVDSSWFYIAHCCDLGWGHFSSNIYYELILELLVAEQLTSLPRQWNLPSALQAVWEVEGGVF